MEIAVKTQVRRFMIAGLFFCAFAVPESGHAENPFVHPADILLRSYVDSRGGVDYRGLKAHRAELDAFIRSLGDVDPKTIAGWPAPERMAFWINAYNLITLQRIVDHYPIQRGGIISGFQYPKNSIRQIDGVWDRLATRVAGQDMTLNHIEHEILRKEFREPRIHAALVCAGKGCPPLRNEAFTQDRLSDQLDDQCRRFLSSPEKFNVDPAKKVVRLSPILKWYGGDFTGVYNQHGEIRGHGPAEGAVLDFASRYISAEDTSFIRTQSYSVEFLDYDWSLNERD
jgi:hypothetical protein